MNLHLEKVLETTSAFKILSDPTRFKIVCLLIEHKDGLCVNELADELNISQSAVSHQLSKLESRKVVCSFRHGQMVCYQLENNGLTKNLRRVITIFQPK